MFLFALRSFTALSYRWWKVRRPIYATTWKTLNRSNAYSHSQLLGWMPEPLASRLIHLKKGTLLDQADSESCPCLRWTGVWHSSEECLDAPHSPLLTNTDRPTHQPTISCFTTADHMFIINALLPIWHHLYSNSSFTWTHVSNASYHLDLTIYSLKIPVIGKEHIFMSYYKEG